MSDKPKCDCHLHERQVCDVCQGTANRNEPTGDHPYDLAAFHRHHAMTCDDAACPQHAARYATERETAQRVTADLRGMRKALLPASGVEAVPGVDPKTTRETDAARARELREKEQGEAA